MKTGRKEIDMQIELCFITGIAFGIEYVNVGDGEQNVVLDFAFLRVLFSWDAE